MRLGSSMLPPETLDLMLARQARCWEQFGGQHVKVGRLSATAG